MLYHNLIHKSFLVVTADLPMLRVEQECLGPCSKCLRLISCLVGAAEGVCVHVCVCVCVFLTDTADSWGCSSNPCLAPQVLNQLRSNPAPELTAYSSLSFNNLAES